MDTIVEALNVLINFIDVGIFQTIDSAFERFVVWCVLIYIKLKLYAIQLTWSFASVLVDSLNISAQLSTLWSGLDSSILNTLLFFRIPECINIIFSALITRFILGLF